MAARCSLWRCGVACGDLDEGLCASIARRRRLQTAWRVRLGVALLGGGAELLLQSWAPCPGRRYQDVQRQEGGTYFLTT